MMSARECPACRARTDDDGIRLLGCDTGASSTWGPVDVAHFSRLDPGNGGLHLPKKWPVEFHLVPLNMKNQQTKA